MSLQRHAKLQVPLELSRYVCEQDLIRPFSVYLYLKMHSDGKVKKGSEAILQMQTDLRVNNRRTFKKYFDKLLELDWIGYNPKTKFFFIRGFQHLRYIHNFRKRRATTLFAKDLNNLQTYLVGAILSAEAKGQEYYWEVVKGRGSRTATNKRDVAKHFKAHSQTTPDYYGLSIKSIARLFNCSNTRAVELKHAAMEAGYIRAVHRFKEFAQFLETDYLMRNVLAELDSQIAKRLRFRATTIKGIKMIIVLQQLFDEIIPLMPFKTLVKFTNLKVPLAILRHFGIDLKKAAA